MAELEAACGRLAALRISDADLAALREANTAVQRAAVETGDADRYYRENERFHHLIYRASEKQLSRGAGDKAAQTPETVPPDATAPARPDGAVDGRT